MDTTNDIRRLILKNASSDVIRDAAMQAGMKGLSEDGWRLVRQGVTTPEEVLRVTKDQSLGAGLDGDTGVMLAAQES
jgi:type II secretory ATPase GspE/PulE/Tfp pilus assembly ATPase PilB-like protein